MALELEEENNNIYFSWIDPIIGTSCGKTNVKSIWGKNFEGHCNQILSCDHILCGQHFRSNPGIGILHVFLFYCGSTGECTESCRCRVNV